MFISQDDIDHILRTGGNADAARMKIAAEFSKQKPLEDRAAFLKALYYGGNGLITDNGRLSAWYRKAGYSKKFLAEHESEITIHKAAKNYFDGLGFKKLPTIKALNTEYAELLAEKKAAYADYRKAREEMKELLTAKANIDRILELDKEQEEANERREKEAEQR